MLGLLVAQTSRQADDVALTRVAGRQRLLSERFVSAATAAQLSSASGSAPFRTRMGRAQAEWQAASDRLDGSTPGGPSVQRSSAAAAQLRRASALQREIEALARRADSAGERSLVVRLTLLQRRYVATMDEVIDAVEMESAHGVDRLIQFEAICAILLLAALSLAIRHALLPTQERLAETMSALAESESRTSAVLDAMREGMLLSDVEGRLIAFNPSAQRAMGFAPGEVIDLRSVLGRLLNDRGEPMQLDELPSRVTLRTRRPLTDITMGVRDSTGAIRWLLVNTHPLFRGSSAAPHAVVAIFRDVTDEHRVEEERAAQAEALEMQNQELLAQADALEREQALFRSLVETAGNAIVGLDMHGCVFEWNREAEAMYGVTRAEALGRCYADDFVPDPHRERMMDGIAAVLRGTALRNHVGPVRGASGDRRTVIWNITPLRASREGAVHGLIAAGLDITEREASDERFRVLFERSSDAHLLLGEHGVIDCNDATLRLLAVDGKQAVLGRDLADLSPRRQPDGRLSLVVSAQMRQFARDRGFHRFEWMHERSDGGEFPVEVTLTPVRLNGQEVMLSVWHDIAERKAVETALRSAKDAAESANRTKSDFMTRMNHELRTPLTAIIGFSKVLLQGKQGALSEGAQRYADRIRANGMHLLSLINQILDVAKVEAGRMELEPERIAVDVLVKETIHMLESTAEVKGVVLRGEMPGTLATVVTDATKLRQILINLVGNAIKFTEQGEVVIRVEADARTTRPLSITVRDTGIGIPQERQQKVFEPFEQGDSSTRRQFGGTGLGLSIVKTFAELIGAAIEVESEVGQGTSFTIWLAPSDLELPVSARAG